MSRGKKNGLIGLTKPRKADHQPSTGWWFTWQIKPRLLRRTEKGIAPVYRKSVYRRSTGQVERGQAIIRAHVAKHGLWCPGLDWLLHLPHYLDPIDPKNWLTLDHVTPLGRGGTWKRENLQVICYKANELANRVDMNGHKLPTRWW